MAKEPTTNKLDSQPSFRNGPLQIQVIPHEDHKNKFPWTDIDLPIEYDPQKLEKMMFGKFMGRSNRFRCTLLYILFWSAMIFFSIFIGYGVSNNHQVLPYLGAVGFGSVMWAIEFLCIHYHLRTHCDHLRDYILKVQEREREREEERERGSNRLSLSSDGRANRSSKEESLHERNSSLVSMPSISRGSGSGETGKIPSFRLETPQHVV